MFEISSTIGNFFIKTVAIGIHDIITRNQIKISNLDEVRYKCLMNLDSYRTAWNKYFGYYYFFVSYLIVEICIIIQKASFSNPKTAGRIVTMVCKN